MDVGSSSSSHYVHQEIVKSASSSSGPDLNVTVTSPQVKSPVAFINLEGLFAFSIHSIPSIPCLLWNGVVIYF